MFHNLIIIQFVNRILYPSVETIFDKRHQVVRRCSSEGHQVGSLHGIADLKEAYDDRTRLGLFFLENRRLRSDLTETYKILNGNCSRPTNREFFLYR